jgi:hypothetical protein
MQKMPECLSQRLSGIGPPQKIAVGFMPSGNNIANLN